MVPLQKINARAIVSAPTLLDPLSTSACSRYWARMAQRRSVNKGEDLNRPLRGLPRQETLGINVRLTKYELDQIDAFIASSGPPFTSRPEAIRRLLRKALTD